MIFFINDLLLGDNLFSWTLLNLSLLLLVDEINLLDFLTSFGVLFLKINVLRSQIFNGLFELFLMLLHLEVKLLSLGWVHLLHLNHFLFVLSNLARVVDLFTLLSHHGDLLLHSHFILDIGLLEWLHFLGESGLHRRLLRLELRGNLLDLDLERTVSLLQVLELSFDSWIFNLDDLFDLELRVSLVQRRDFKLILVLNFGDLRV